MATTACVLYPQEKPDPLLSSPEHWKHAGQAPAHPISTPNIDLRATLRDLTNVTPGLSAEDALCQEIDKLCTATLVIDQVFYDVGRRLSDASKEQNKRTDLFDTCHNLEAQWKEHHQTYQKLLWRSREFSGQAQAAVDDFCEVILPSLRDGGITRSEKQEIIQNQLDILQSISQPSQNLCQEVLDLGRALDTYIGEFSRVVECLRIGEQTHKVRVLEEKLRGARAAMEVVSQELKQLGWNFAKDVAKIGIAVLLAFLAPTCWEQFAYGVAIGITGDEVMHSKTTFFEARSRCNLAIAEYEAIKSEYDIEKACLGQMVKLESALHDSKPLIQEVMMRLGIFATVWAAITADIRNLKSSLEQGKDVTSPLFVQRVRRLEKMYGCLRRALRLYQIAIWPPMPGTLLPL